MVSAALVMLMVPGVGLFYAGLVRRKNIISMIALSFVVLAVVSIFWMVIGYSLAFGPDIGGVIGNLDYAFLNGVGTEAGENAYPPLGFMVFQLFFAAVTLTIITSGVAERVRLSSFIVFMLLWTTFVYCPIAHWAWGGGWAQSMGLLDFAGGTVVEICSGFSVIPAGSHPCKRACSGSSIGIYECNNCHSIHRERTARIKTEPAEPEQCSPDQSQGNIVGLHRIFSKTSPAFYHKGNGKCGKPGADLNYSTPGKIQKSH